ncbi:MAG: hypothetical protein K2G04_00350 [Oscillospiraceae bacterium]|nr:hypothetical protein [Oscillospiraceae bacterium]
MPIIKIMFWKRRELATYCGQTEAEPALNICGTVLEAFDYLLKNSADTRTVQECTEEN